MIIELVLMSLSIVFMAILIVHKRVELSRGYNVPLKEVREKTDPILRDVHRKTHRFFTYITLHNAVLLANYIFVHVVRFCMHASNKVHRVSSDIVSKASKKTEDLSRGGAASFYLKKIKENKVNSTPAISGKMDK